MAAVRARFQGLEPVLTQAELLAVPITERFDLAAQSLHRAKLLPPAADARWLERAHHTSLAQYQAYLDYRPVAAADPALVLALITASDTRSSDMGYHHNRLLTIPDLVWHACTAATMHIRIVAGDNVTIILGAGPQHD